MSRDEHALFDGSCDKIVEIVELAGVTTSCQQESSWCDDQLPTSKQQTVPCESSRRKAADGARSTRPSGIAPYIYNTYDALGI